MYNCKKCIYYARRYVKEMPQHECIEKDYINIHNEGDDIYIEDEVSGYKFLIYKVTFQYIFKY